MLSNSHKLLWIHSLAFVLIATTWLAALAIPAHKASTMSVAPYYVLHIFTASAGLWAQLASSRPFFHLHGYLFYTLLALVFIDIIATLADRHHHQH